MILASKSTDEAELRGQSSRPMMAVKFQSSYEMGGTSRKLEFRGVWNKIPQL